MHHTRAETPAYLIWVEQRPTSSGKGKDVYFEAVRQAATQQIDRPISVNDIEVEIVYSRLQKQEARLDADNVNKPTLDALNGVAYVDDALVRSVTATVFERNSLLTIGGRVEHMGRLFYSPYKHVLLIMIYSDSRLAELGGEQEVQRRRYIEWQQAFEQTLS